MSLNSAQNQAIAHHKGPCMVLAGPGSGKTTVITNRIEYLIQKHKVRPEEILVITFSNLIARYISLTFLAIEYFCTNNTSVNILCPVIDFEDIANIF